MFNLHLIDVSALLHYGMTSVKYRDKRSYGFPVGGIHKVMYHISVAFAANDDVILVFDGRNNFRKGIMPEYKAGRIPNKEVIAQADFLYNHLLECNIECLKMDGFEGDDIINWVSQKAAELQSVFIIGNDKDLVHNVHGNITFHSIDRNVNCVSEANFPFAIEKGVYIPFNFVNVRKVLTGCPSDKVPPFVAEDGTTGAELFDSYIDCLSNNKIPFTYSNTASKTLFLYVMNNANLTEKDKQELQKRVKVIFPADVPEGFSFNKTNRRNIDKDRLSDFLTVVGDNESRKSMQLQYRGASTLLTDEIKSLSKKLISGEYAVDNNIPVNNVYEDSVIFLKEF